MNNPPPNLSDENRKALFRIARDSIEHGLKQGKPLNVDVAAQPKELQPVCATFVTLDLHGDLRGCIGSLKASLPLAADVAHNAFEAAFGDPRFRPLRPAEFNDLEIHISVLSPLEKMSFKSEDDFLGQLRPGVDGILLQEGFMRGTFLPSVWEQLPKAGDFLKHLKLKAGLPVNYWSDTVTAWRYTTEYFP